MCGFLKRRRLIVLQNTILHWTPLHHGCNSNNCAASSDYEVRQMQTKESHSVIFWLQIGLGRAADESSVSLTCFCAPGRNVLGQAASLEVTPATDSGQTLSLDRL